MAWSVVAYPSKAWAGVVFPGLPEDEAQNRLMSAILQCCYVDEKEHIVRWDRHIAEIRALSERFSAANITRLHFTSAQTRTDITIGLCEDNVWAGGANTLPNGATYTFNMPTEEIYNAPHTSRVDGFIRFSKPCCFAGDMIDDFWLAFQNGEVVDFGASVGYEILKSILNIDEGAKRLGEVAIVPCTNPVNQTGLFLRMRRRHGAGKRRRRSGRRYCARRFEPGNDSGAYIFGSV